MSLGNLAENIYNGNVSLDAAKQEQRRMENVLEHFIHYNPVKTVYKNQRANILLNAREFYKGRKPYVFGENQWKERDLGNEKFTLENPRCFLEKYDRIPLSEKENELFDRDFGMF